MITEALSTLRLHLAPGEDLREALAQRARRDQLQGFVLGVVGNLSQAAFQCPGRKEATVLRGELEIISLQGTFSPDGVHLHLSFSDAGCQVWGGHLEPGTLVLKGADLLLALLPSAPAQPNSPLVPAVRVELVGRSDSPLTRRAQRMLRTLGIPHRVVVGSDPSAALEVRIDGRSIGDYEALASLQGRGELEALRP
jgi:predicted DNA-binding protein with PD1-like motif